MRDTKTSESVWDYPRPPRIEPDHRSIVVSSGGMKIASSKDTVRVLETSHPPVFYIPPRDVDMDRLTKSNQSSFCEFKGRASYWDLAASEPIRSVAWSYESPSPGYEALEGWLAFYPSRVDCYVDGDRVAAQEGDFYGGWITPEIVGPFKGGPGTWGW